MKILYSLFALIVLSVGCRSVEQVQHPNIIYVLADDMGYGDIKAFNPNGKIPTPNLDKLAAGGIMFTDAHTSSSVCTPTRYGILTGRYNWRSKLKKGVLTGKSKALIPRERTTVASMLQSNGYHTSFIGKWHLGWDWGLTNNDSFGGAGWNYEDFDNVDFSKPIQNGPNELGFDYSYGHSGSLDMAPYVYVENGIVTQLPDRITENTNKYSWWRKGPTGKDFIHEDVTPNLFRRSFSYIEERTKSDQPFFLYLPLPSPHTPILPSDTWQGKSSLNPYGDFVMMIDHYMGQLEQTLTNAGIADNTMIVFTSDNGCSPEADFELLDSLGHDPSYIYRGHKADIFEGGHRVPMIVKWPNRITEGIQSDKVICTTDLMATAADIVGYELLDHEGEDSFSMLPYLTQKSAVKSARYATIHHSINGQFAIRKGDWKLIMCPDSGGWSFPRPKKDQAVIDSLPPIQLYNLILDPGETNNLHADYPEKVSELKELLSQIIKNGRSTIGKTQSNDPYDGEWSQISFMD